MIRARRTNVCGAVLASVLVTLAAVDEAEARQRAVPAAAMIEAGDVWRPARTPAAADVPASQIVTVQFDVLREAARKGGILTLPLAAGLSVRVATSWVHADATQSMIAGPLLDAEGEASLTLVGDALAGRIVVNGRLFVVRRLAGSDAHLVSEIAQGALPPEAAPRTPPVRRLRDTPRPAAAADTNAFVDLMILYTPVARAQIGGTSAMVAELTGAVNNANLALANAGVVHRFRLVHSAEIAYTETGDIKTTLNELTDPADGKMDGVLALRNQYRADVVTLLSADSEACGIGWLMGNVDVNASFEDLAYNVTYWNCANANLSMAHEIGHNMGLHHDRPYAGGAPPAFPYAYGYAVNGVARDVMAYANTCTASGCPRLAIYSTPLHNFPGTGIVAGTPTEDNARALNGTSSVVANFRQSQACSYSLASGASVTYTAAGGNGRIFVTTAAGCAWTASSSNPGFLTITGAASGTGNGSFTYLVAPNTGGPRSGTFLVSGVPFSILQMHRNDAADFDDDGRSDISIYRPSSGGWYILSSGSNFTGGRTYAWGAGGDVPLTGDFDGDARNDLVVFRPTTGRWFVLTSTTNFTAWLEFQWNFAGAIPVPGDYDGDGRTDLGLFVPSTGTWRVRTSSTNYTGEMSLLWGLSTDIPAPGDYDGDRKTDFAVYRPSSGRWYISKSTSNYTAWLDIHWGIASDIPVAADYDGDRKTDVAVYRNGLWYILTSGSFFASGSGYSWGTSTDVPAPGDYDGDGRSDITVYRPSTARWYILKSTSGYAAWSEHHWGAAGDVPVLGRR